MHSFLHSRHTRSCTHCAAVVFVLCCAQWLCIGNNCHNTATAPVPHCTAQHHTAPNHTAPHRTALQLSAKHLIAQHRKEPHRCIYIAPHRAANTLHSTAKHCTCPHYYNHKCIKRILFDILNLIKRKTAQLNLDIAFNDLTDGTHDQVLGSALDGT